MKRILLPFSCLAFAAAVFAAPADVRIEAGGAEILIDAHAPKTVAFAASEMQDFLGQVLGAPIPVVNVPTEGKVAIVLGSNDWSVAAGIDTSTLKRDAFVTKASGRRIYIAGRDDPKADIRQALSGKFQLPNFERATVFGVYAFLEDVAGCRFYFPGEFGTVVPRAKVLTVPAGERTTAPVFTVRDPYLRFAKAARPGETAEMSEAERQTLRLRQNNIDWLRLRFQTERIPCCHGQNGFFYTERFRETHPEYLRLKADGTRATELELNGNRHAWQIRDLCHTSKVWDEIYEDVKAYLTGQPASCRGIPSQWSKQKFAWNGNCVGGKYVDIMPQDGFQKCHCENCQKAYTDEQHYATDLIWGQTAKLAWRLKAEGVKGYVTQMAYTPYARVPDVELPDNVLVMVARTGPWRVTDEKVLAKELSDYRAWSEKVGGKVWIWTYPHKYGGTAIPDVPCMAPKAWGVYYQRAAPWIFGTFAECETDRAIFNYLNYYVFSKVAWNPGVDVNAILDDHHAKMFAAGAAEMKTFYEELEEAWLKVAGTIVWDEIGPQTVVPSEYTLACEIYSSKRLARWSKLCDVAIEKNASNPDARKRINFVRDEFIVRLAEHFREYRNAISVEKALARRAAEPARPNIIDPKGWSIWPSKGAVPIVDETVKGPTGANAFHTRAIDRKAYLSGTFRRAPYLLKPNTRYRLSCFLKAKDVVPFNRGGIYLEINNGASNWAESSKPGRRFSGTTDWVYHEMEFKTSDKISPKAFICLRILNATGEAWFDGVRLEEIEYKPDPLGMILPRPQVVEPGAGTVSGEVLARVTVARGPVRGAPAAVACEAYALEIRPEGVLITAPDARGERYARVTLAQLAKLCPGGVPVCKIRDWPVLRWRGYMNDCGRNYLDMVGLKAILDVMAAYKLNLFHWHLTDYHGWRLESKKHPSLQDPKAFRRQIGRYYTQDEFREIVDYAAARGITVMPELDVPGHTLALRKGLGVDTMAAPGVEKTVTELFEELCSLAPADVMPFVHLGTDEARTREEKCDDAYVTTWAKAVNACGRKAVVWAPGKRIDPSCDVIDMAWYDNHVTNSANPFLYADYVRFYNGGWTPFDVLSHVAFADPRHWKSESGRQIGAVGCTWHDDNVGEDTCQLFRDCMVFPSLLGFADNYWSGRSEDHPEFISRLPRPEDRLFAEAQELENRLATHRDVFFGDFPFPFPFVRQTALRWRITDMTTGQVLARDVPQGTIWVTNRRNVQNSFSQAKAGTVSLEMWIGSPSNRTTGAWIDCTGYYGAYSRLGGRTPHKGEWNRDGAKVFVNGIEIPPPDWKQPGMVSTTPAAREQDIPYSTDLLEKPLIDELPTLRAPTKLSLKKGWNHVRIVLPKSGRWCCTFCPVDGTSEHPREVEGLQYASDPP